MFEDILNTVKQHLAENPEVANAIPAEQQEAIHQEIATHLAEHVPGVGGTPVTGAVPAAGGMGGGGMFGGLMGQLESAVASGNPVANAVEGGLVASLTSKFGLSPAVTGAIAASLPGLLQKLMSRPTA